MYVCICISIIIVLVYVQLNVTEKNFILGLHYNMYIV